MQIDLNELLGVVIYKTLEFAGVDKTSEEVTKFCEDLVHDDDVINACLRCVCQNN